LQNFFRAGLDAVHMRLTFDIGRLRRFIRIVQPGEIRDFTGTGAAIQALGIALLADIERRVDKDFQVSVRVTPNFRTNRAIRSDNGH
jgi:hypothetical protein